MSDSSQAQNTLLQSLDRHIKTLRALRESSASICRALDIIRHSYAHGGKVLLCGNGGSAADAQHIAAELVVRYQRNRRALAAIALTTDTSVLTAYANDYDFEMVFARQVEAIGTAGDCLVAISTSGNSANVLKAVRAAHGIGLATVALTGSGGGALAGLVDAAVVVPSAETARIQEAHIFIAHWWCEQIEEEYGANGI